MEINERIFYLLKQKKKTAKELSDFIGVKQSSISAWKNGSFPSSKYIIRISEFLDVSPTFLLTGKDEQISKSELSEGERDLLYLVHDLTNKEQQRVVGVVENYLGKRSNSETIPKNILKSNSNEDFYKLESVKKLAR